MTVTSSSAAIALQTAVQSKTDAVNIQVSLDVLKQKFEQDVKLVTELMESGDTSTYNYPSSSRSNPGQVVDRMG